MDYLKLDRYYFDVAYKMKQWRRIQFLGMIVEYAFSGEEPECKSGELFALFNLVKPDIDRLMAAAKKSGQKNDKKDVVSDEKTNEKPVKNTENSSKTIENTAEKDIVSAEIGKRESSPIPPKRINNKNLSIRECGLSPERENEIIDIFKKKFRDPAEELKKFVSFYKSMDWTNSRGKDITDQNIVALAELWETRNKSESYSPYYIYDDFVKKFGRTNVPGYAMLLLDGKAIYAKNENVEELVQNGAILKRMG
ncbi:MAG: hypothetical protein E7076_03750 [Bacteroidales bacterium]|nr:hypothetical protein [Bacteroidales bacterium]